MAKKLVKAILLLFVFSMFVAENAASHRCPKSKIGCLCDDRLTGKVKFFEIRAEFFVNDSRDCPHLSSENCADNCRSPIYASNSIAHAAKRALRDPIDTAFPLLDVVSRERHRMLRDRRFVHYKCSTPRVEHASLACSNLWGELIPCEIECFRGYALEDNGKIMRKAKRVCHMSKSAWFPTNTFPVCKPYINCEAVLVKPGNLTCYHDSEIPYCNISCEMDIEKGYGETVMERYECVEDYFVENLPHCAKVNENVDMIKPSENREVAVPKTV